MSPYDNEREQPMDLGMVTHVCLCGSKTWKILVTFDDYEIGSYSTDMYCFDCGCRAKSPTPLDKTDFD